MRRLADVTKRECTMPVAALGEYDDANIFARILRGEIPSKRVYEDDWAVAFHDINPQAPVHVLVIPRGRWRSWADFSALAPDAEIAGFVRAVGTVARDLGLEAPGYRLLANAGIDAHQEVPHLHVHLFAGKPLGPMLAR
jgi:diadenosine tetraphosphate (Ap4A) HIT family hydrolase